MKDILNIMKQAKEMQSKMSELQEDMANVEAQGTAGGGMVTITLSGKGELKGVAIDPSLLSDGEAEMIEDLLIAAHADAKTKVEEIVAEKTKELTAGLPIPPGMKLPF
jgi:nucleoid-associated protein EbfC